MALSLLKKKESAIFLALLGIMGLITIFAPKFASGRNLYLVTRQISYVAIVAYGVFFVILTGGIDLSVGSVLGLSGVTAGMAMAAGSPPLLAAVVGMLTGIAAGLVNGALVAYVGVAPFIVTLGMMSMARGLIWVLTKGWPITEIPESFVARGQGSFLGIPFPVFIMLVVAAVSYIIFSRTTFGRRLLAIGGNEEATALSGINVRRVKFMVYGLSGLLSSLSGILLVARFSSAQSTSGEGWELDAIAAAVIGGTSLAGGEGSVVGILIGAAIMGVIRNGLVLMKVSTYWQTLIIGAIIVLAAIIDVLKNRRR